MDPQIPPPAATAIVQAIRVLDPVTVSVELGPRFSAFRASTQQVEQTMRLEDQAVKDKRAARALREQVIEDLLKRPARLWDEE